MADMPGLSSSVSTAATGTAGGGNVFNAGSIFGNATPTTIIPSAGAPTTAGSPAASVATVAATTGISLTWWIVGGLVAVVALVGGLIYWRKRS